MFNQAYLLVVMLGLLSHGTTQAAVTLQLNPASGNISGLPGATVGWGFSLSNTENYLVVTGATFDSATSSLGTFTDYISAPENFFVVGPGLGASTTWAQSFDANTPTGIGSFAISPNAALGSSAYGEIVLNYDLFSRSPFDPNFNPDIDTLSNGNVLTANASVSTTIVPLPAAFWLFISALGVAGVSERRNKA